jgi:glutaminyl-peptide cyclotransferase
MISLRPSLFLLYLCKLIGWGTAVSLLLLLIACNQTNPTSSPPVTTDLPTPIAVVTTAVPATQIPTPSPTLSCEPFNSQPASPPVSVPTYGYKIINSTPHDPTAFTQGLIFVDGILYESTGIKLTPSSLRRVDLSSGEVLQYQEMDGQFFGEGLTLWQDKLIQLTWQNQIAFVYDKESFAPLGSWSYSTQGWGLTHNGRCLIMSDGSSLLYFRDPETFAEVGRILVQDQNGPVTQLNELEFINGEIWANVWKSNRIVRIDPASGQVVGNIDLTGLLDTTNLTERVDVLNGIAYDEENGRIFVTGKLWPTLFEIELVPTTP